MVEIISAKRFHELGRADLSLQWLPLGEYRGRLHLGVHSRLRIRRRTQCLREGHIVVSRDWRHLLVRPRSSCRIYNVYTCVVMHFKRYAYYICRQLSRNEERQSSASLQCKSLSRRVTAVKQGLTRPLYRPCDIQV